MKVVGIDHVQITIPTGAEEQARAFYCGLLGLTEILKPAALQGRGGFWLQTGDRQIHVGVEDGVERTRTKGHVAYAVDDLDGWRDRLAAARVALLESVPIPGYRRFEFRDPFGNRVEFIQPVDGDCFPESVDDVETPALGAAEDRVLEHRHDAADILD